MTRALLGVVVAAVGLAMNPQAKRPDFPDYG
jgi:hypothetical protein